ncbi:ABC transporter ATP-binding protein [Pseudoramibacter sp.]|jgi:ATP-binding cassette subfamily B protein|uniref:ABC transporter ATP-binding protein n=1 Tax=Pseudoramibacter sp. TaxID=2034862 RepID=UPI0025CC67DC|nr:ABC transporter ATP-binding protein [Pseudoramibacter sp.]MCH4071632.1 ABC transporter ATP-binding protein/permease [Pseudoramibacter sp.]MCH4105400.1 ABC transporter ATP-binding protein/permease [Pseudoramibacter sp.]
MIKKIMESVREYKKASILSPVFVTLEVVMEVIIPILMARLIDQGLNRGNMRATWFYGIIMLACAAVSLSFGALAGKFCATASTGLAKNLRHDLFAAVQGFSFKNIDDFSTGSLVTRMTTDVTNVQMAYMLLIRIAFRAPLMLIFSLIMSFVINARMSLYFLIAVPILGVALGLIIKYAHPLFRKVFKIFDRLNTVVQENLRGIRVVKSYVRKDHEIEKFDGISGDIYTTYSKAEKLMALNSPVMQAVMYACMLVIAWAGAKLIVAGSLTTGQLTSLITYIMMILMSLMMLSMIFVMLTIAQASGERIVEVLNTKSSLTNAADPVESVKDGSIVFDNVSFSYADDPNKLSLKNINLNVKPGEQIGIIGGTGSAKSSLVQLIPRLYDATVGTVYVGGIDVKNIDLTVLRHDVSMVLQKNVLFAGTIADNLRWGNPDATDAELWRACEVACADEFIREMPDGLDTMIEQGGTNVSGGQKQRLCIARAVLAQPKILILDDSTSAVDTKTDAKIRKGLKEVIPGTTTLIIAQRISSIEGADRIVVMEHGTIADVGTSDELLSRSDIYREVYNTQMQMKGGQTHAEA